MVIICVVKAWSSAYVAPGGEGAILESAWGRLALWGCTPEKILRSWILLSFLFFFGCYKSRSFLCQSCLPCCTTSFKPRSHMGNRSQTSTPWAKVSCPFFQADHLRYCSGNGGQLVISWWQDRLGSPAEHAGFQQQRLRRWKKASPSKRSSDVEAEWSRSESCSDSGKQR